MRRQCFDSEGFALFGDRQMIATGRFRHVTGLVDKGQWLIRVQQRTNLAIAVDAQDGILSQAVEAAVIAIGIRGLPTGGR
ncbi:hypothetical protein D3M70_10825 [Pseudomonas sp. LS-2]|nr:hypothetical protein D3M70_10825 [Pseudomonas sp. LS-2]